MVTPSTPGVSCIEEIVAFFYYSLLCAPLTMVSPIRALTSYQRGSCANNVHNEPPFCSAMSENPSMVARIVRFLAPIGATGASLEDLHVQAESEEWISEASRILRLNGCLVLSGLIDPEDARASGARWQERIAEAMEALGESDHHITDEWGAQNGLAHWTNYKELADAGRTIYIHRDGTCDGMVDVFNIQFTQADEGPEARCRSSLVGEEIRKVIAGAFTKAVNPSNLNIYQNKGVQGTRGLHFDSLEFRIKVFAYLSDVEGLDSGPYVYVPGSHSRRLHRRATQWLNRSRRDGTHPTDATLARPDAGVPMFGAAGTIIISDQRGIHRGWPQSPTGSRVLMVQAYDM